MPRAGLDPAAVVDAAAGIADRDGVGQLTLARVAAELGVRAPSLYAHVDGLDDLRRRLAGVGVAELTDALSQAAAGRAGRDALHAVAVAYRDFAHRRPGVYEVMQRAPADVESRPGSDAAREAARLVGVLTAVLRGYGLDGDDAIHGVRLIRSALHGFVTLEGNGGFALRLSLEDSYERLIAMLDRGLRDPAAGP
jgi:AcrR family transcriptional regulator